ncbi:MAG: aminopeptidase [Dermatophilaceae bacterium]
MREPWHELTARYAQLIVGLGANVQPRQRVIIACQIEHADMARAVADAAYRAGASRVSVEYDDPHVQRFAVEHAPADALGQSLPHEFEAIRAWARDEVALIRHR